MFELLTTYSCGRFRHLCFPFHISSGCMVTLSPLSLLFSWSNLGQKKQKKKTKLSQITDYFCMKEQRFVISAIRILISSKSPQWHYVVILVWNSQTWGPPQYKNSVIPIKWPSYLSNTWKDSLYIETMTGYTFPKTCSISLICLQISFGKGKGWLRIQYLLEYGSRSSVNTFSYSFT